MAFPKANIFSLIVTFMLLNVGVLISDSTAQYAKHNILIANISIDNFGKQLSPKLVELALNFAAGLSKNYHIFPNSLRDSIVKSLEMNYSEPSALNIAKELSADNIFFVSIKRLKNVMRADIINYHGDNFSRITKGKGYAFMNFRNPDSSYFVEPPLGKALQRAMAMALADTNLFSGDISPEYRIKPAPTLVIAGFAFKDDNPNLRWELFQENEIISYDMVETIFEKASENPNYVVFDTETRDTVYLMANLYGIDNSRSPTIYETAALRAADIDYFITGEFEKSKDQAIIKLALMKIVNASVEIVRIAEEKLTEDNLDELRLLLRKLTSELLGNQP